MKRKVAVESSLSNVSNYLKSKGYDVYNLTSQNNMNNYDAIVVTGQDKNFLGMEDTSTKSVVIDARGKTPEEICNTLDNSLK